MKSGFQLKLLVVLISLSVLGFFATPAFCAKKAAFKLCKNDSGVIRIASRRCKNTETAITNISQLSGAAGQTGPQGSTGSTGPQGIEGPSNLLAVAFIDESGVLVSSYKGPGVTSLSAEKTHAGEYRLTLSGTFSSLTSDNPLDNQNNVFVLGSARSFGTVTANAYVESASASQIQARISTFNDQGTWTDYFGAYLAVFLAN